MSFDYLRASNGEGEPLKAIVVEDRDAGNLLINVDTVLNWPATFVATTGTLVSDELDPASVSVFFGSLSGGMVHIDSFAPGYTDLGNTEGQVILLKPTTAWADEVADAVDAKMDTATYDAAGGAKQVAFKDDTDTALATKLDLTGGTVTGTLSATGDVDFSGASSFKAPVTIAFSAYMANSWNGVPTTTYYTVPIDTIRYNYGGCFNKTTHQFVAPYKGVYHFDAAVNYHNTNQFILAWYLNGAMYTRPAWADSTAPSEALNGGIDVVLNVGDTFEVRAYTFDASDITGGSDWSYFSGHLVGIVP